MKANITAGAVQLVPINSVRPYPNNARRGEIATLKESLTAHGQYRPIVVQSGTNYILAGNHTWKAMKELGIKSIKAVMVDVDDVRSRKIVLADNRMTDLADYNETLLKALLEALPDVQGTGFNESDIAMLDKLTDKPQDRGESKTKDPEVKVSAWRFQVSEDAYKAWRDELQMTIGTKFIIECGNEILRRLAIAIPPEVKPVEPERIEATMVEGAETLAITEILPHPYNPRIGDVGAITESLKVLGQYRPLVVNRRTMRCLSGNHTLQAMASLGWEQVAVSWVDVDEEQEIKILLVDNRTSDLATYDNSAMFELLKGMDAKGTGFSEGDMADIIRGGKIQPRYSPVGRSLVRVGDYKIRVHTKDLIEWAESVYGWRDVAELLQMPIGACYQEEVADV